MRTVNSQQGRRMTTGQRLMQSAPVVESDNEVYVGPDWIRTARAATVNAQEQRDMEAQRVEAEKAIRAGIWMGRLSFLVWGLILLAASLYVWGKVKDFWH